MWLAAFNLYTPNTAATTTEALTNCYSDNSLAIFLRIFKIYSIIRLCGLFVGTLIPYCAYSLLH